MFYPKDFFDLQFTFAERVQALAGVALDQALFEYTIFTSALDAAANSNGPTIAGAHAS